MRERGISGMILRRWFEELEEESRYFLRRRRLERDGIVRNFIGDLFSLKCVLDG